MDMKKEKFKINYTIFYRMRRTLSIQVERGGSVKIYVPQEMPLEEVEAIIEKKRKWILKKKKELSALGRDLSEKNYQDGQQILYLGEEYLLVVNSNHKKTEKKEWGEKKVVTSSVQSFKKWYRQEAQALLGEIMTEQMEKVRQEQLGFPQWGIRKMKRRWGSCSYVKQKILLNQDLIKIERELIKYVVMHEICHLKHPNHSLSFYKMFSQYMPDWKDRKEKINKYFFS